MKRFERIFREGNRLTSGETQILVEIGRASCERVLANV